MICYNEGMKVINAKEVTMQKVNKGQYWVLYRNGTAVAVGAKAHIDRVYRQWEKGQFQVRWV